MFLDTMEKILPYDLIVYTLSYYLREYNIKIIVQQKLLKKLLNQSIHSLFNTYYCDNSIMLYKNKNNQMVLKQKTDNKCYLYSNTDNVQNDIIDNSQNTETVLFHYPEDNQIVQQRKIKLYIVYI
jgi:predicted ATP-binding protein involved in virulence